MLRFEKYKVTRRFFNLIFISDDLQGDKEMLFVAILFWTGFKITLYHNFNIGRFEYRIFKMV
jgi:hypothetical protein